jgi:hypothetical protein
MLMRCDDVFPILAGVVDGSTVLDRRSSQHVASCLRCQAELVQYRRLLKVLHQLREQPVAVPGDLGGLILDRLDRAATSPNPWVRRAAYAGAVAATAAGAAGAIVLVAGRNRKLRLAS